MVVASTKNGRMAFVMAATLAGWLLAAGGSTAEGALLGLWRLDEVSGTTALNDAAGGTDGTLNNGPVWTYDTARGNVIQFDGGDDWVDAGFIPAMTPTNNFTWSFWTYQQQGVNNDVALGNRWNSGSQTGNEWIKFTARKFEYWGSGVSNPIDYVDIPQNQWVHHAVVKNGNSMTYYRNGVAAGTSSTITGTISSRPFYIGGDKFTERWQGRIDDVAIFDEALSVSQVQTIMGGDFGEFGAPRPTGMSDAFDGASLDTSKWAEWNKGLEYTGDSGYNPPSVGGGTLTLGGTTTHSCWGGKSVRSTDSFEVPSDGEVKFEVDRVSLTGSGHSYRSSMWMYADGTHFHHYSQNIGENGWQYNAGNNSPVGGGNNLSRVDYLDSDGTQHTMGLVHDGAFVKMFLDGRWVGSQAANFNQFQVMLTGQAWGSGNTVQAVFDNAAVSTRTYTTGIYDNFNSGAIDPAKWTVIAKGLESQGTQGGMTATIENGELLIQGSVGAQYWHGLTLQSVKTFSPNDRWTFSVDRDALTLSGSGARGRSGLWIWADDDHFLYFGQATGTNEYGWQYNYADGAGVGSPTGYGVNIAGLDPLDGDGGSHELKVLVHPDGSGALAIDMFLDDQLAATQLFNNWGTLPYHFMLSGMPRASGDSVFVAFDNVQMRVPEPASWLLLSAGAALLLPWRRRRRR